MVVVGDGKTYEHLLEIKQLHGTELERLLIFPGDWHILKNFQPVLMKIYNSAGLEELAKSAGFRAETLTSLKKCSNFKRTHQFLLQVWQSVYRHMINAYIYADSMSANYTCVSDHLSRLFLQSYMPLTKMLTEAENLLLEDDAHKDFQCFVQKMCDGDDTWKFWSQFVLEDCMSYVGLFLAIRCQRWDLRVASSIQMATLFSAFDWTTYRHLIPNHLADLQTFPPKILHCFKGGAFVVNITGTQGHMVALDEAHETLINKDMKAAVVRPTKL